MKSILAAAVLLGAFAGGASAAETLKYDETPATCEFYAEDSYADDCGSFSMTQSESSVNFNYVFEDAAVKFLGPAAPIDSTEIEGQTFYVFEVFAKRVNSEQYEIDGICMVNEAVDVSICQSDDLRYVYSE